MQRLWGRSFAYLLGKEHGKKTDTKRIIDLLLAQHQNTCSQPEALNSAYPVFIPKEFWSYYLFALPKGWWSFCVLYEVRPYPLYSSKIVLLLLKIMCVKLWSFWQKPFIKILLHGAHTYVDGHSPYITDALIIINDLCDFFFSSIFLEL